MKTLERLVSSLLDERVLAALYVVLAALVAGGVLYVLAFKPPPMVAQGIVAPGLDIQTSSEIILVALSYLAGFIGFYTMITARRHVHNPRYCSLLVIIGALLVILSAALLGALYRMK